MFYRVFFRVMLLTGGFALLLTVAGIHAVISFAVSRRTREIGVRVALGADRARIAGSVLSRMARRVALGVILGAVPVMYLSHDVGAWQLSPVSGSLVVVYIILMIGTCMIPCIVPTLRALRIQPTEALAAEG